MNTVSKLYEEKALPELAKTLGRQNVLSLPRLSKVSVSMGFGSKASDRKHIDEVMRHLSLITGQKAVIRRSRRAVSGFRLRIGMDVGCMVTLRRQRMHEFLDRLINFTLPRVRDFRGLNDGSFDGAGNYSFGLNELSVFPEIDSDEVNVQQGLNVTVVTTARNDEEGRLLLKLLGFPFKTK